MMSGNDRGSVEAFLIEARQLIADGRYALVPRDINTTGLAELGITPEQAWDIIAALTTNNYCKGPEADRDREGWLWFFGASIEKRPAYIKLKIEEGRRSRFLKCVSFHPADEFLRFPLRPVRQNRRPIR